MDSDNCEESELLVPQLPRTNTVNVYIPKHLCLPSKAAILILVWTLLVGALYATAMNGSVMLAYYVMTSISDLSVTLLFPYALLAIFFLFYPLSGFLADVCCGRYRAVVVSLGVLFSATLFYCVDTSAVIAEGFQFHRATMGGAVGFGLFTLVGLLLFGVGMSAYQANFIQLGLDQLMDAPSRGLGLFIHWVMWCDVVGTCIITLLFATYYGCALHRNSNAFASVLASLPYIFLTILAILLLLSCYTHRWFYTEPGHQNPYKMVLRVLNFARKNKCPIHRSALTYHEDVKPSRIDFAKDRYGGPFTSEEVEDVKTFFRILLVLFCLGPVFILEVPSSYFVFPIFSLHAAGSGNGSVIDCTAVWILLQSGSLQYIVSVVVIPVYIWVIYTQCKRIPRILKRLWIGIFIFLLAVLSMLVIDLVGHFQKESHNSQCMFGIKLKPKAQIFLPKPLQLPWWVLLFPTILLGVGPLLVNITTLEFISAQSPHSMKGLLVGLFFAIKGVSQLFGAFSMVPFTYRKLWNKGEWKEHPPIANCAFGFFLFSIVVALIGLILFSFTARRYKYRQRGEQPYAPHIVEEIVGNNLSREMPHVYGVLSHSDSNIRICDTI